MALAAEDRKKRKKEKIRRSLLDAARGVFSTTALHKATMEEIADKADYSPATLYLYFKNKDDLYAQVNQALAEPAIARMEEIANRGDLGPTEKLQLVADLMYRGYEKYPFNVMNTVHYQTSHDAAVLSEEVVEAGHSQYKRYLSAIGRIFEQGNREGCFDATDPDALADVLWSLYAGSVLLSERRRFMDSKDQPMRKTLNLALEVFLKGLARETPQKRKRGREGGT